MRNRKRWTKEEEHTLVKCIQENHSNIQEACLQASIKLDRTAKACAIHWYSKITTPDDTTKNGVTFISVGSKSIYKNRKNNSNNTISKPEKCTLWVRIKKLLKLK